MGLGNISRCSDIRFGDGRGFIGEVVLDVCDGAPMWARSFAASYKKTRGGEEAGKGHAEHAEEHGDAKPDAIVSATTCELAPGYAHVTCIESGVMAGCCAIGIRLQAGPRWSWTEVQP